MIETINTHPLDQLTTTTDQEKKWQAGNGKLMRDFATFKDFYSNKLMNQEQSTKQLRKKQKELKEEYGARTNQKTIFNNLFALLEAKQQVEESMGNSVVMGGPGSLDRSNSNSRVPSAGYARGGGSGGGRGERNNNHNSSGTTHPLHTPSPYPLHTLSTPSTTYHLHTPSTHPLKQLSTH